MRQSIFESKLSWIAEKEKERGLRMSFMLQHLNNGWQVDQAILSEEDRIVLIRLVLVLQIAMISILMKMLGLVMTGTQPA